MGYDLHTVKQAATHHWAAIANRVAGIDDDYLHNRRHGPCPKCGGKDRWRVFNDFAETGGAICNQCGTFADGIALIQWSLNIGFIEALQKIGDFLGIPETNSSRFQSSGSKPLVSKRLKRKTEPKNEEFNHLKDPISDDRVLKQFSIHRGCSLKSIKRSKCEMRRYRGQMTVCFPVLDSDQSISGYTIYDAYGGTLPKWNASTKTYDQLKVKTVKK